MEAVGNRAGILANQLGIRRVVGVMVGEGQAYRMLLQAGARIDEAPGVFTGMMYPAIPDCPLLGQVARHLVEAQTDPSICERNRILRAGPLLANSVLEKGHQGVKLGLGILDGFRRFHSRGAQKQLDGDSGFLIYLGPDTCDQTQCKADRKTLVFQKDYSCPHTGKGLLRPCKNLYKESWASTGSGFAAVQGQEMEAMLAGSDEYAMRKPNTEDCIGFAWLVRVEMVGNRATILIHGLRVSRLAYVLQGEGHADNRPFHSA